jgi:hypothetical protein
MADNSKLVPLLMSTLREFGSLGAIVRDALHKVKTIKNAAEPVTPKQRAENQGGHFEPKSSVIPNIPPPQVDQTHAERCKDNTPPWKRRVEIAALFTAIGLLGVNTYQSCSTHKAADAARGANDAARDALVRSQRPWLGFVACSVNESAD